MGSIPTFGTTLSVVSAKLSTKKTKIIMLAKNNIKTKIIKIFINAIPIIIMMALIPLIVNDYLLSGIYLIIIIISLIIKYKQKDYLFLLSGFFIMLISEYFFISTGVEIFIRNTLFGIMPLWLPILWAYAFIVIKRTIIILDK